jgi:hypothetical protein
MVGHQCRWEFAVTCESCGLVGHASSFEELQWMRARHEERDGLEGHSLALGSGTAVVRPNVPADSLTASQVLAVCNQ